MDGKLTYLDIEKGKERGLSEQVIRHRFYGLGWSKERAISQPLQKRLGLWPKYRHLCEQIGISEATFCQRMKKYGWSPEKAATTPKYANGKGRKMVLD